MKYLSTFLEVIRIAINHCKIYLKLKHCALCDVDGDTKFNIIGTKLFLSIVTFSTKDLSDGFKRSIY